MKTLIKQGDQCPYTQIPNELIEDKTICPQTRFLYVIIRSQANDWEFFQKEISKRFNISKVHYTRGLTELEERGWIRKERTRTSSGTLGGWTITVYNIRNQTTQLNQPCGESTMMVKTDDITIRTGEQEEPKEQIMWVPFIEQREIIKKEYPRPAFNKSTVSAFDKAWDMAMSLGEDANIILEALRQKKKTTPDPTFWASPVSFILEHGTGSNRKNADYKSVVMPNQKNPEPERWGQYA